MYSHFLESKRYAKTVYLFGGDCRPVRHSADPLCTGTLYRWSVQVSVDPLCEDTCGPSDRIPCGPGDKPQGYKLHSHTVPHSIGRYDITGESHEGLVSCMRLP